MLFWQMCVGLNFLILIGPLTFGIKLWAITLLKNPNTAYHLMLFLLLYESHIVFIYDTLHKSN